MRLSIPKKCYNINIIYIIYKLILEGGEGNASKSWFYGGINFRHYGILEFTALGAGGGTICTVEYWSLVFIATCSVRSSCLLYIIVVVSIVFLSHPTLCPVVREW